MMYSVLMCTKKKEKKEEQFKHSSRRNTKVCTNTSPIICTRYKLALYRVLEVYILPGWEASRQRVRLFFRLESTDRRRFGGGSRSFLVLV